MISDTRALHVSRSCIFLRRQSHRRWPPFRHYVKTPKSHLRAYATTGPVQRRPSRIRNILLASSVSVGLLLSYIYITDTRASIHRWVAVPLIRAYFGDPEDAHIGGVRMLKELYRLGLHPRERNRPDDAGDLKTEVFNHTLANPLGISSGLDKHGEIPTQLLALGPAVVEIGGVTPSRQSGNPKPRVFRIVGQKAMINVTTLRFASQLLALIKKKHTDSKILKRYGLNSVGAAVVSARLRQRVRDFAYAQGYGLGEDAEQFVLDGDAGVPPGSLFKGKLLAVNIAKSSSTSDGDLEAIGRDYVLVTSFLARYADIIVVNVSCPNASGFRELQETEPLTKILTGVVNAATSINRKSKPAVMVKVSPDEDTEEQVAKICAAVWDSGVDGVVVGNTTKRRGKGFSESDAAIMKEQGGYSGPQLFPRTLNLVKMYRRILDLPLHGQNESQQTQLQPQEAMGIGIEATIKRDEQNPKDSSDQSTDQPSSVLEGAGADNTSASLASNHHEQSSTSQVPEPAKLTPKVIFCTGGIENGQQVLDVLNAGASVAQIYSKLDLSTTEAAFLLMINTAALVYGGVGKITSMKQEMRGIIRNSPPK